MIETVYNNEPQLLENIIKVHIPDGRIHLDPMYFKGNFYKNDVLEPVLKYDLNPIILGVERADARSLPIDDKSITSMILDPPFMFGIHGKVKNYYSSKTHGVFKGWQELELLYKGILQEAKRVLNNKGILIFKCQDYTDSKTTMVHCYVWQWAREIGFYAKDLAILHLPKGKVYNPNLQQRHLRKTHSYFWVFT